MAILKYTTQISVDKTIGEIQSLLVKNGARSVLNNYDDNGYITSLSFQILVNDVLVSFRLPTECKPVLEILDDDRTIPYKFKNKDQAQRVAWRIVLAWVEAQMALLQTRMVKIEQIFLPYAIMRDNKTVYEKFLESPQLLLN
jgi:hypothetical protein